MKSCIFFNLNPVLIVREAEIARRGFRLGENKKLQKTEVGKPPQKTRSWIELAQKSLVECLRGEMINF
jgi:hypothetical protein